METNITWTCYRPGRCRSKSLVISVPDQGALFQSVILSVLRDFSSIIKVVTFTAWNSFSLFFFFINSDHIIATRKNRLAYKYVVDNKLFNHLNYRPFTILLRVYALESSFFVLMEWVFYNTNKRFSRLNHEVIIVNYLSWLLELKWSE